MAHELVAQMVVLWEYLKVDYLVYMKAEQMVA